MVAPIRLDRDPPIRRSDPADWARARCIYAEDQLGIAGQRMIGAALKIEHVIEKAVSAKAGNPLRKRALDKSAGGWLRCQGRANVRKAPGRYCVPNILHRRVIVQAGTEQEIMVADLQGVGISDIGVVPAEAIADAVVRSLDERTKVFRQPAAGKQADFLHGEVVIRAKPWRSTSRLTRLSVSKCRLQ